MLAVTLGKMGVGLLEIFDDDVVDEVNLATQLHKLSDVGKPKAQAVANLVNEFSDDCTVFPTSTRIVAEDDLVGSIIISGVDSIGSRQAIWNAIKGKFDFYIDARMGSLKAEIFIVQRDDETWYEELLMGMKEDDIPSVACTEKSTFFCSSMISGIIGSLVMKIATGDKLPKVVTYDLKSFRSFVV
jgi:molybdopterin/thiamine biosynthesis adenylyltransferase